MSERREKILEGWERKNSERKENEKIIKNDERERGKRKNIEGNEKESYSENRREMKNSIKGRERKMCEWKKEKIIKRGERED